MLRDVRCSLGPSVIVRASSCSTPAVCNWRGYHLEDMHQNGKRQTQAFRQLGETSNRGFEQAITSSCMRGPTVVLPAFLGPCFGVGVLLGCYICIYIYIYIFRYLYICISLSALCFMYIDIRLGYGTEASDSKYAVIRGSRAACGSKTGFRAFWGA